jgi:hypothetical protein
MVLLPAGFINEQHEPPTFLGARRPDVERRILPATWRENGAGLFGDLGPFSYRAYVLAGFDSAGFTAADALRGGRQSGAQSKAEDLALALRLDYTGAPGLLVGGFFYRGGADQGRESPAGPFIDPNGAAVTPPTRPFSADVTLFDLHAEYRARGAEFRALYAGGSLDGAREVNDANGVDGTRSVGERFRGWYAQAGYDVMALRRAASGIAVIPFVRYERLETQERVPGEAPLDRDARSGPGLDPVPFAADPANDVRIWTYGVAYKPILNVSVKLDYQDFKNEAGTGVDQLNLAVTFLF